MRELTTHPDQSDTDVWAAEPIPEYPYPDVPAYGLPEGTGDVPVTDAAVESRSGTPTNLGG